VLFGSQREVHTNRLTQLFTVPIGGGAVSKLPVPSATRASFSPDGKTIAYIPLRKRSPGGSTTAAA
jgi:tricorn protease